MSESIMTVDNKAIRENVEAAKAGDKKAFARLITLAKNTVTSISLAIVKDIDNSEEVAQQVFINVWHNLKSLKNNDSFLPWIRQTARYQAFNFLRDNKVSQNVSGEKADQLLADFCDPRLANDQALEREQQSAILSAFISELPKESREIVLLYYREEQSSKQVSKLLNISEINVRKKLSRARVVLKLKILKKYGRLVLSTAPTIGFTSAALSALSTSNPVAAAALAASAASTSSGKVSLAAKFLGLIGGAMIGVAFGVLAIYWRARISLKKITNEQAKRLLIRNRNQTMVWLTICGIILTASYELTAGWIAPMTSYCLYALVVFALISQSWKIIDRELYPDLKNKYVSRKNLFQISCRVFGIIIGFGGGFLGLYLGLVNGGRL